MIALAGITRWQDLVFTVGSLMLLFTLIPMFKHRTIPPYSSSIPIAVVLYVFSFTYLTLHFVIAPVVEFVQASMWAAFAVMLWWSK